MKTSDVLERMADKIRQGWCKEADARTVNGIGVSALDPRACHWCIYGAETVVRGRVGPKNGIESYLYQAIGIFNISEWDDSQKSKKPVMAAILKARELALEAND